MFSSNMEFIARERHRDLLHQAEQIRLIKTLRQQTVEQGRFRSILTWIGVQMVKWGLKLQGHSLALPPRMTAATVTDGDCS